MFSFGKISIKRKLGIKSIKLRSRSDSGFFSSAQYIISDIEKWSIVFVCLRGQYNHKVNCNFSSAVLLSTCVCVCIYLYVQIYTFVSFQFSAEIERKTKRQNWNKAKKKENGHCDWSGQLPYQIRFLYKRETNQSFIIWTLCGFSP